MIETIRIHAIDVRGSVANGPGVRATVFMQGCDKKCPGCHNPETWSADGGEPLRQPEALGALLKELKREGFETAGKVTI